MAIATLWTVALLADPQAWAASQVGEPQSTIPTAMPSFTSTSTPSPTATATATPSPTPTATPTPTPPPTVAMTPPRLSSSDFGLVFVNSAESPGGDARIRRGVATGVRLDRFPLYWDRIEAQAGQFDWSAQDAALRANEAHGLGTLAILLGTPAQYYTFGQAAQTASPRALGGSFVQGMGQVHGQAACRAGDGPSPPQGLYRPVYADGSDRPAAGKAVNPDNPWARFVQAVVDRYRPGGSAGLHVRHWEVWNEPDLCHFWSGSAQDYARLLKVAYLVIKQRDPEAVVLWGGLAHFANEQFLTDLVNALRADPMAAEFGGFFDAAASHHYSLAYQGYAYTARVRRALADAGWPDRPVWITESGVPICNDYPGPTCPSPWRATPEEQAAYIWQNVAYTRLAGGGPIFHFMLHDDCGNVVATNSPDGFGLVKNEATSFCSPANAEPRLAYTAFQLANRFFPDTELAWADILEGSVRRVAFYHPETNQRRLLVWNLGRQELVGRVPAAGTQARRIALDGNETLLTPENGEYLLLLPGATNRNWPNPDGDYDTGIYGRPYLLVEEDNLPPTTAIQALPPISRPTFQVSWQAVDWGSGVTSVSLWTQVNDGPWQPWLSDLAAGGTASFSGEADSTYRFAALATDRAGNALSSPSPQAETRVSLEPPRVNVVGRVIDVRGRPVKGALVAIGDARALTDDDGYFTLAALVGRWDVAIEGQVVHYGRLFERDATLGLLYSASANAIVNGNFEDGLNGWTASGSCPLAVEAQPDTVDHALHLATAFLPNPGVPGEEGSEGGNSTVSQRIQVPTDHPYLAFAYRVDSRETDTGHDRFEVIVAEDGRPADYLYVQETGNDWRYLFLDMESYAGREVSLIFNVYQSSPHRPTSTLIDLVTVSSWDADRPSSLKAIFLPLVVAP